MGDNIDIDLELAKIDRLAYWDDIYIDTLDKISKHCKVLTTKQIDKYFNYLIKGNDLSAVCTKDKIYLLDKLTKHHVLSSRQVDKIINQLLKQYKYAQQRNRYKFKTKVESKTIHDSVMKTKSKWITNLTDNKYEFTPMQLINLYKIGYNIVEKLLTDKKNITLNELEILCAESTNILENIISGICKSSNIIPNDKCLFNCALSLKDTVNKYQYSDRFTKNNINFKNYIKLFIDLGYIPTTSIVHMLLSYNLNDATKCRGLEQLLKAGAPFDDECLNLILTSYCSSGLLNILLDNNIVPKKQHLLMSLKNNSLDEKTQMRLIEKYSIVCDVDICDMICLYDKIKIFDYLEKNNLFVTSENSLNYACSTGDNKLIVKLINMRLLPNQDCIKYICCIDQNTLNLLIAVGLPINYNSLDVLYAQDVFLYNLDDYNLKFDDNMYFIYHKYNKPSNKSATYGNDKNKLTFDKSLSQFRREFENVESEEELQKHLKKYGREPDLFCYDNALMSDYDDHICKILEEKYGFKPTIVSIMRIEDLTRRQMLLNKYYDVVMDKKDNNALRQMYVDSVKQPTVTDPDNINEDIEENIENIENIDNIENKDNNIADENTKTKTKSKTKIIKTKTTKDKIDDDLNLELSDDELNTKPKPKKTKIVKKVKIIKQKKVNDSV